MRVRYQQKLEHLITCLWYGPAFIVNKKWKTKIYKMGKVDDRIPVLQLTRSSSKKQEEPDI